tara:strand:- start:922 stop:2175 length:1254 start_codon:yes stop_codon:yes gene_type:complete
MKHFFGIVEDRHDPLKIGRVRVRIHGIHTDNKLKIATPDLPWAQVILPTTSAGLSGMGMQHGLVEGSTVFGYFRDGETCQDPVVLGVSTGVPQSGYRVDALGNQQTRTVDKGFNDPRRLTLADYDGTPDVANPEQDSRRPHGLTSAIDSQPKSPKEILINYDATGSTITEIEATEDMLPWYPLYLEESDVSSIARGDTILDKKIEIEGHTFPDSVAEPVYPYNKVYQSESGHVIEVDDTVGKERLSTYHRSGTFQEVHPDGSVVQRIVNDNYQIVAKDDKIYIAGNADLTVEKGNVTINVNTGNVDMKVLKGNVTSEITEGNLKADILKGTTDVLSEGKITITGNNTTEIISDTTITGTLTVSDATTLQSTLDVTGKQTNSSSITASGEVKGKGVKLSTHKHTIASGSSAGKTKKPD